jgi:hypothetical protein
MSIAPIIDLRKDLLAVRDQGTHPTCLAHAASTAHEHIRKAAESFSAEYLHVCGTSRAKSRGLSFRAGAEALEKDGQPIQSDFPYRLDKLSDGKWKRKAGFVVFRRETSTLDKTSLNTIETLLNKGTLPLLGISLPERFYRPSTPWIISPQGAICAKHVVLAVGAGKHKGEAHILIRNSWGTDWGDKGHAWLSDTFLQQHLHEMMILTSEVDSQ